MVCRGEKWESLDLRGFSEHYVFYFFPSVTGKIEIDTLIKQTADTFTANMNKHWPEAFSSVAVTLSHTVSSMCSTASMEIVSPIPCSTIQRIGGQLVASAFEDDWGRRQTWSVTLEPEDCSENAIFYLVPIVKEENKTPIKQAVHVLLQI